MSRPRWCGSAVSWVALGASTCGAASASSSAICSATPAYQPLDLTADQVDLADLLPFTRDPFDALVVAAAQSMSLPLITRDGTIRDSGAVAVVW